MLCHCVTCEHTLIWLLFINLYVTVLRQSSAYLLYRPILELGADVRLVQQRAKSRTTSFLLCCRAPAVRNKLSLNIVSCNNLPVFKNFKVTFVFINNLSHFSYIYLAIMNILFCVILNVMAGLCTSIMKI